VIVRTSGDGTNFHLGAIAHVVPSVVQERSSGIGSGDPSSPEAEAVCRHCFYIFSLQKRSQPMPDAASDENLYVGNKSLYSIRSLLFSTSMDIWWYGGDM